MSVSKSLSIPSNVVPYPNIKKSKFPYDNNFLSKIRCSFVSRKVYLFDVSGLK